MKSVAAHHHPILLLGLRILDFTVIYPFEDGNGRIARLLTNALLGDSGYTLGRDVSLEQEIADSSVEYYNALLESTHQWHDGGHDPWPWPWPSYFTTILATAYERFGQRAAAGCDSGSKQDRVRAHVLRHVPQRFPMAELRRALPGISDPIIRLVLDQLRKSGQITAEGSGRSATWRRTC
ncbi:MAG TPA: Fic family protein [Stackebrandtia sp.]|uniref:Fic family protein n=1 Tax=Stackebrandtia sp. TaxID=2023065 RepID=UPI002D5799F2|nr:Fic family protein [Stackebrandtia sp.]HZE39007.1 Fic family protein [Stackebrandtia sp.]